MMLGARLLMGVAEGGIMPISQSLIAAEVEPRHRGLAMGVTQNFGSNLFGSFLRPCCWWPSPNIRLAARVLSGRGSRPAHCVLMWRFVREFRSRARRRRRGRAGEAARLAKRSRNVTSFCAR